jgi:hypothetical protein
MACAIGVVVLDISKNTQSSLFTVAGVVHSRDTSAKLEMVTISYMRAPYLLEHFYGITESYVFHDGNGIVDHGDNYANNPSFIELIGEFVRRETSDDKYALKIMRVLAEKLGCMNLMREHPITDEENDIEEKMLRAALSKPVYKALHSLECNYPTSHEFLAVWDIYLEHLSSGEYMNIYKQKLTMNDIREFVKNEEMI